MHIIELLLVLSATITGLLATLAVVGILLATIK